MKPSPLILLVCFFFNSIKAQKTTPRVCDSMPRTIEINFSDRTNPKVCNIKRGDYYYVKITNINLNLFKVSLTSIDTVLSKTQLTTPTFGNLDLDAVSKVIGGISSLSTTISQLKPAEFSPVDKVNTGIADIMNHQKVMLLDVKHRIEQIASRIDSLKLEVYKLRLNSYTLANARTEFNFAKALAEVEEIRKDISVLKTDVATKKSSYDAFSTANKGPIANNARLTANDKLIKEAYEQSLSSLTDVFTSISADKVNDLLSLIVFIENNANNIYTSLPMQFMGEQATVQIAITPRDDKYNLQSYYSKITFPQDIKWYTVVGISFYGSNLHDEAYSTIKEKINDSTYNYTFKKENNGEWELGIAALLRYGKKLNDENSLGFHGSLGAGISISNKVKPRVLGGIGFTLGKKHMFAIDFGGIVGYSERLSSAIDLSKTYSQQPDNITVSKIGIGIFGSIGYTYQF